MRMNTLRQSGTMKSFVESRGPGECNVWREDVSDGERAKKSLLCSTIIMFLTCTEPGRDEQSATTPVRALAAERAWRAMGDDLRRDSRERLPLDRKV
jgi:hypothetical protein